MGASDLVQALGSIGKNFSEGYRQARAEKTQEDLQRQNLNYEHAHRLFDLADRTVDPKMKDSLFASATQMLDAAENPPKATKKPGVGTLFANLFGIGKKKPTGVTTTAEPATQGPTLPDQPVVGPAPAEAGSQTYGNLGDMFGEELQSRLNATRENANTVAPPGAPPELPTPPLAMTSQGTVPRQGADLGPAHLMSAPGTPVVRTVPSITDRAGTPVFTPPPLAPVATPEPEPQQQPVRSDVPKLPGAADIIAEARAQANKQYGPKGYYQAQQATGQLARQKAQSNAQKLLQITDQHLADNGHLRTVQDASNDPVHGMDFRNVMDTLSDYESAGLLAKGTVENWQKSRFAEAAKYDPNATAPGPDGSHYQFNPASGKYDIRIGPAATPKEQTHAEIVDKIWEKDPATWTNQDKIIIQGEKDRLAALDKGKISREDQLKADAIDEITKGVKNGPALSALKTYMPIAHPVAPPTPAVDTFFNPASGHNEPGTLDRNTGKVTFSNQSVAGSFNPSNYEKEYSAQVPNKINPRIIEEGPKQKTLSADRIISAHSAGLDPAINLDLLQNLLANGAFADPADQQKMQQYIARQGAKTNAYRPPK